MPHIAAAEGHEPRDEGNQGDDAHYPIPPRHTLLRLFGARTCLGRCGMRSNPDIVMDKTHKPAICVFCGASFGNDPRFREAAEKIGAGIAAAGYSLVFGGGGNGLMGVVARAVQAGGAAVQGIIPVFLQDLEPPISAEEKLLVTPHIQERKALMLQMSDAFVVLPGGLGTLDEFFEVATEAQLGVHKKPIIVVNVNGYYNALDALLRHVVEAGLAKDMIFKLYHLADGPEDALKLLADALAHPVV